MCPDSLAFPSPIQILQKQTCVIMIISLFSLWQTWQVRHCSKATKRLTIKMSKTFSCLKIYNIQVVMLNNDSMSNPTSLSLVEEDILLGRHWRRSFNGNIFTFHKNLSHNFWLNSEFQNHLDKCYKSFKCLINDEKRMKGRIFFQK